MKGRTNRKELKELLVPLSFYITVIAVLITVWWWEGASTGSQSGRSAAVRILKYLGDAAVIILPFIFLNRRFRWTVLIPVYVITFWSVGSVWYYRFWGDLPGIGSILLIGNVGTELTRSVAALWLWIDVIILLLPAGLTGFYLAGWRRAVKACDWSKNFKLFFSIGALILFITGQLLSSHIWQQYAASFGQKETLLSATRKRVTDDIITNSNDLAKNGPVIHFFKSVSDLFRLFSLRKPLEEADRKIVETFLSDPQDFLTLPDSLVAVNRKKNIILIMVESLNAYVLSSRIDEEPVAPVLNSLMAMEGTLSALNVVTQVKTGGSSDGQLMINTGLYPLVSFPTANVLGNSNTFPSLAEILDKEENVVIFGDDGSTWNERSTFSRYGFEKIFTRKDYPGLVKEIGGDGAMFRFASELIPELKQPFFLELLTVSMHVPFNDPDIPAELLPRWADGSDIERNYLAMVNYFDSRLGEFIEMLKGRGIYDDTLIIIVSDHSHELTTGDDTLSRENVPMMMLAVNCGMTGNVEGRAGQIDIFPTLLDLVGKSGAKEWRGAGKSMLLPGDKGVLLPSGEIVGECDTVQASRLRKAKDVSEIILRTDYFAVER